MQRVKIGLSKGDKAYDHKIWYYIAKYGFGKDGGDAAIRVRLVDGISNFMASDQPWDRITVLSIDFNAYNEKKWYVVKKKMMELGEEPHHEAAGQQAHNMCRLEPDYHIKPRATRTVEFPFDVSTDDDNWGDWTEIHFNAEHRAHMWYFTLSDCRHQLKNCELEIELRLTQANGEEFSVERQYSLPAHYIAISVLLVFMMYWFYRLYDKEGSIENIMEYHPLVYALSFIMLLQFIGHFCHLSHLSTFKVNGVGNEIIDTIGEILMALAQVTQVFVLILLGGGYAITQAQPPDPELMVPIVLLIVGVHGMAVVLAHYSGTEGAHRFHGHEGMYGYFMTAMRLLLYMWFLSATEGTKARGSPKVKSFIFKLQATGSLYFLTYPVMFVIIRIVAPYFQHRVMQAVLLSMHFMMNVILAHMFLAGGEHFRLKSGWADQPCDVVYESDMIIGSRYDYSDETDEGLKKRSAPKPREGGTPTEIEGLIEMENLINAAMEDEGEPSNKPAESSTVTPATLGKES